MFYTLFVFLTLSFTLAVHSSIVTDATVTPNNVPQSVDSIKTPSELNHKYLIYDPRVGRMHNQLRALSVALVFARSLNRTVIIPPLDDGVDFADYFDVAHLRQSGLKFLTWSALRTARCAVDSVTVDSAGMVSASPFQQFLCSDVATTSAWSYFPQIPQNDPDIVTVSLTELGRQVHDVSLFRRHLRRQHANATQTFMLLDGLPFYYCKHASGHPLFFSWPMHLRPVSSIRQAAAAYIQSDFGVRPYVALHSRSMHVFCNAQVTISADQCQPPIEKLVQTVSNTIRTNFSELIDTDGKFAVFLSSDRLRPADDQTLVQQLSARIITDISSLLPAEMQSKYYALPLLEIEISVRAAVFFGSRVSTFSSFIALRRSHASFEYNGVSYEPSLLCSM